MEGLHCEVAELELNHRHDAEQHDEEIAQVAQLVEAAESEKHVRDEKQRHVQQQHDEDPPLRLAQQRAQLMDCSNPDHHDKEERRGLRQC